MYLPRSVTALAGAAFLLMAGAVQADGQQEGTVTGQVMEAGTGQPLQNVQVHVPGTGLGSLTRSDGTFQLERVPAGDAVIRAELIGYGAQEEEVAIGEGETVTVEFELRRAAMALDRIVVTGTGAPTEQRRLGHTVGLIDADGLQDAPVMSVGEMLSGREAGVSSLPTGGHTGEGSRIRIRGSASLAQSNEPIIYLDGVRMDNSSSPGDILRDTRLDDINPDAIERIEVLKGAAAATLYGTEASSGVIQIFTRSGRTGAPQWTLSLDQSFSAHVEDRYDPHAGFARTADEAQRLGEFFGVSGLQPFEMFQHNYWPEVFETGVHSTGSLSVSGGTETMTYMLSGRVVREDGPMGFQQAAGQSLEVPGFQLAQDLNELNQATGSVAIFPMDDLRIRVQGNYTERMVESVGAGNCTTCPYSMLILSQIHRASEANPSGSGAFGSIREFAQRRRWTEIERFGGSFNANYSPVEGVNLDATFGVDIVNQRAITDIPFGYNVDNMTANTVFGLRNVSDRNQRDLTLDVKGSWDENLTDRITSQFTAGFQVLEGRNHTVGSEGEEFPAPGLAVTEAAVIQSSEESFLKTVNAGVFSQLQLGLDDWVFATGGLRYDKHSAFGEEAEGALYPKISVSVVPSSLPDWDYGPVSTFRVRGAIGQSGLQPGAFDALTTFSPVRSARGGGVQPDNLGNPNLEPEVSTEWEVGFETGLWEDRVALDVTYWDRQVENLLVARQFAPSGGFLSTQLDNLGQMDAYGIDLSLRGTAVSRPGFSIDLHTNAAYLREQISDLGDAPEIKVGYYRYATWHRLGYAPGANFGPLLDESVEYPVDLRGDCTAPTRDELLDFVSVPRAPEDFLPLVQHCGTGNEKLNYMGKPVPNWSGSFGGDLRWNNFTLSTLFSFQAGDYSVHNITNEFRRSHALIGRNIEEIAEVESVLLNPASTPEERLDAAMVWSTELYGLSPYDGFNAIEKADFIRWRELSLTYRVPSSFVERFGANSMSVTAAGRNLGLLTGYSGLDPEANVSSSQASEGQFFQGMDAWQVGLPRRLTFSTRISF